MPRFEKWLTTATAEAPADSVARAALAERLIAVRHFLDHALSGSDEAEGIHQLRVWTRRASAALKLFEPALPNLQRNYTRLKPSQGADAHAERMSIRAISRFTGLHETTILSILETAGANCRKLWDAGFTRNLFGPTRHL